MHYMIARRRSWARATAAVAVAVAATSFAFTFGLPVAAVVAVMVLLSAIGGRALAPPISRSHGIADAQSAEIAMQHQLEHVAALAPGVICTLAPAVDGWPAVTYSGPGLDALFGESRGPVVFRSNLLSARTDLRDIAALRESFEFAVSGYGPWQHEFRINHPRSGTRWIAVTAAYDGSSGCGLRWHAFLEDVTARHHPLHVATITEQAPKMGLDDLTCPLGVVVGQPLRRRTHAARHGWRGFARTGRCWAAMTNRGFLR
jgi:hypothetical protein